VPRETQLRWGLTARLNTFGFHLEFRSGERSCLFRSNGEEIPVAPAPVPAAEQTGRRAWKSPSNSAPIICFLFRQTRGLQGQLEADTTLESDNVLSFVLGKAERSASPSRNYVAAGNLPDGGWSIYPRPLRTDATCKAYFALKARRRLDDSTHMVPGSQNGASPRRPERTNSYVRFYLA